MRSFFPIPRWVAVTVLRPIGRAMFEITIPAGTWRCHLDQMQYRHERLTREVLPEMNELDPLDPQADTRV